MGAKYELSLRDNGKYMFNLKSGNGQVILTSQLYADKRSALAGVESVRTNSPLDERFERKQSSSDQPYFVLRSGNNQVIGKSQMYSSEASMEKGIESVRSNGPSAPCEEESDS